jgi:hypothetical protein
MQDSTKGFEVVEGGVIAVRLGSQTRRIKWTPEHTYALENKLEQDALAYIQRGGGSFKLMVDMLFIGISLTDRKAKIQPADVAKWWGSFDGDGETLLEELLYAMARCLPIQQQKERIRLLDMSFRREERGLPSSASGGGETDTATSD